jgi:hypothetical protein
MDLFLSEFLLSPIVSSVSIIITQVEHQDVRDPI